MSQLPISEPGETRISEPEGSLEAVAGAASLEDLAELAGRYPACLAAWAGGGGARRGTHGRRVRLLPGGVPPRPRPHPQGRLAGQRPRAVGARAEPRVPARLARPAAQRRGARRA